TEHWTLAIDGEVENPLRLSLSDLKAFPRASATCVLQCAGNGRSLHSPRVPGVQWGSGAVGNARWTGARVKDLLARAGARPTAGHLHTFGADVPPGKVPPFHRSIPMDKIAEDGIVAYEMNGAPLPHLHGFPARLILPGWTGTYWMKHVTSIKAVTKPEAGFWMKAAYRIPLGRFPLVARFTSQETAVNTPITEIVVSS